MGKTFSTGLLTNGIWQDSSNNIGIGGAANASYKLAVTGASLFSGALTATGSYISNVTNGYGLRLNRAAVTNFNGISHATGGVERWFVGMRENLSSNNYVIYNEATGADAFTISTSNNNIGIGTSSITNGTAFGGGGQVNRLKVASGNYTCLEVNGNTSGGSLQFTYGTDLPNQVGALVAYNYASGGDMGMYISNVTNGIISFATNNTERMRITSGGITFLTADGIDQLRIRNASDNNRQLLIGYDYANNYASIQSVQQTIAYRALYLNKDGGAVYAGSVRLDTLSDERVKDNIQNIDGALNKVLSITGKKFHLKDEEEGKLRYGFIAQELEGILDEFVIQTDMTFKKDDLEVENVKSIENWASSWSALLVEAIKEQQEIINQLSAKVTALENK